MDTLTKQLVETMRIAARDRKLLHAFLGDILTPAEYRELARRWQIVLLLARGVPQRTIAKRLKVSIATVTRGSRELQDRRGGFWRILTLMGKGR